MAVHREYGAKKGAFSKETSTGTDCTVLVYTDHRWRVLASTAPDFVFVFCFAAHTVSWFEEPFRASQSTELASAGP
jgi:hypothetical protein